MWGCNWNGMLGTGWWSMGGGFFGMFWTVLLLVGGIYLVTRLLQYLGTGHENHSDRHDSMDIIKKKYAKGEISSEEYQRMKDVLSN